MDDPLPAAHRRQVRRQVAGHPLATAIDACRIGGVVADRFSNYGNGKGLRIPRADVRSVAKRPSGVTKQIVVTLADGQEFAFDNGFLSVDELVATLGG